MKHSGTSALPTVYKRSAMVHITRINSLMTFPVLFGEEGKELFCTVSKKKVNPTYRPCFLTGKEPETQLFFFLPNRQNEHFDKQWLISHSLHFTVRSSGHLSCAFW